MARHNRTGRYGLYQRHDGRYVLDLRWRSSNGEQHRKTKVLPGGTKAAAAKRVAEEALHRAQTIGDPFPKAEKARRLHASLDAFVKWCETQGHRDMKSRKSRAKVVKKHMRDVELSKLAALDLERLKKQRKDEGAKPATINRAVALVKAAATQWADWGWITDGQLAGLRRVKLLPEPEGRVRELSDDERERLYKEIGKSPIRPIVTTILLSGLRRANVVGLEQSQVDLQRRRITIVKNTKSRKRIHVPINDALASVLEASMEHAKSKGSEYVFLSSRGRPYTGEGVRTVFKRICDDAGIKDLRLHDLRHDYASKVRRAGHGLDVIQRLLGHSSLAMSARYAHLSDDHLQDAVADLAAE